MAIMAKSEGGTFKQIKPATYAGRCYSIIDLGTQKNEYMGEVQVKHQVLIGFEIPSERYKTDDNDLPMTISKFYTLSLHEKANLCIDLQNWRGKEFTEQEKQGFDITNLIGVPAMLNVIEKNGKSKIGSISPMMKGMEVPPQEHDTMVFDLDAYLKGDESQYEKLSEGIRKIVDKCIEISGRDKGADYTESNPPPIDDDDLSDPIPF